MKKVQRVQAERGECRYGKAWRITKRSQDRRGPWRDNLRDTFPKKVEENGSTTSEGGCRAQHLMASRK